VCGSIAIANNRCNIPNEILIKKMVEVKSYVESQIQKLKAAQSNQST
jgi:hypothetical protein